MSYLDEISPPYVGEDRLALAVDDNQVGIEALKSILVNVDYSACAPEGAMCPLVLEVHGPSERVVYREYLREPPTSIVFTPHEGGAHRVLLRELAHNHWWGRLELDVEGERLTAEAAA